ncbi:unnamed protein product [Ilex paraguariensis]|uniref:Protein PRD1 n=1 Tax=Ilex paraguariensis TaxID=185542 RepID=A0ABC8R3Z3_9AQUA
MQFTDSEQEQPTCLQGHRSSLILQTLEGGNICLLCVSNLISNPKSPTVHVSYALSQLSHALSQPQFLHSLLTFHSHFLVSPLVQALSSFDDEPIANQIIDLIIQICSAEDCEAYGEFVTRVGDKLSSGALGWSRRQVYMVHCLGVLLDHQEENPYLQIKDKNALVVNLVTGLQLPSEDIRGEILFVLYKISLLQYVYKDDGCADVLFVNCPKLLYLSLEALMKTQSDDVRLNCVALLTVLAQRGFFQNACANDLSSKNPCEADNFMHTAEHGIDEPLNILFAEAVKGPLLSSDSQVQIGTLDLIFLYLSWEGGSEKEVQILVEENIADYVFEILRLSGCKDPIVNSCIQVLDLLSTAEQAFRQRLAIGFTTLVPVLRYVAGVPFHPVQTQTLKLIWYCVSDSPGIASSSHIEELGLILTGMFKKHIDGDTGMLPEAFTMACTILVTLMQSPLSNETSNLATSVRDASRHSILTCLNIYDEYPNQLLHSLYLLKEAYAYSHEPHATNSSNIELRDCILDICKTHMLPWFIAVLNEMEEEDIALGILETFHSILLQHSVQAKEFTDILVSSSWFSLSFGCLGLFPSEKMKSRVYLMFSSIMDVLLGNDSGQPIRDSALHLPSDPMDLLFLLGQKSSHNLELASCQFAVLLILYASSLHDDRLADEKLVLTSLEQYILVNSSNILYGAAESITLGLLINLYGLYRGLAKKGYQIPYSPEAERILFHLMDEKKWDFLCTCIHMTSLKWLFQQEKICKSLSNQILKFCRCNSSNETHIIIHRNSVQNIDLNAIGELIASDDNFGATLFVCLLRELVEEGGNEHDFISVVNILAVIIDFFPAASDQLCLHGIASPIHNVFCHARHCSSPQTFRTLSQLIFIILRSVHPESLSDDEAWLAVTMKLMDYLIATVDADGWTEDGLMIIGILCLILHFSTNQKLVEASKTILLSSSLGLIINNTITEACARGPALVDYSEGTKLGETLIFVLSLHYFSLRSVQAVLPWTLDWKNILDDGSSMQTLSFMSIHCRDLCRLMHFGSPLVKLVASYCLLELFTGVSEVNCGNQENPQCTTWYLLSVMAVLEGQIFCSDIRVAMNCSHCLSMILSWEKPEMETRLAHENNWCRLVVEELAMSLAVPCLASKSFMFHHKPAVHVAVALLKQKKVPGWMTSVFDDSCIFAIVKNLSPSNVSTEMVLLFRKLLNCNYLKAEQIAGLNRVFQACRKCTYKDDVQDVSAEEHTQKMVVIPDDLGKVCEFLIDIMSSQLTPAIGRFQISKMRLLEEIELFSKSLIGEDDG